MKFLAILASAAVASADIFNLCSDNALIQNAKITFNPSTPKNNAPLTITVEGDYTGTSGILDGSMLNLDLKVGHIIPIKDNINLCNSIVDGDRCPFNGTHFKNSIKIDIPKSPFKGIKGKIHLVDQEKKELICVEVHFDLQNSHDEPSLEATERI